MIAVRLMGGLCNQMFQIAFIETLGAVFEMDVLYTNLVENCTYNVGVHHRPANDYFSIFQNLNWFKNQSRISDIICKEKVPTYYIDIIPRYGTEYIGYFQSEKYFDKELAKWLFQPDLAIDFSEYSHLFKGTTCSVHVRRGDYLKISHIHPVLDMSYYKQAILNMDYDIGIDRYLVFSDDIAWCKENFVGEKFVFVEEIDYIALFLMAKCDHHIIANSSFSWWGAYLGKEGTVIAPQRYICNEMMEDHRDVVPKNWIKI
jgi:hypothetical protein